MFSAAKRCTCVVHFSRDQSQNAGQRTRHASYFYWLFCSRWSFTTFKVSLFNLRKQQIILVLTYPLILLMFFFINLIRPWRITHDCDMISTVLYTILYTHPPVIVSVPHGC